MAEYTQAQRNLRAETTLGEDALLLERLEGEEGVSSPFLFTLDLLSDSADGPTVVPEDMLRTPVAITLELPDGEDRPLHGLIRRFTQLGRSNKFTHYRAEMVPWLWFLSLTSECRIYQNLSVPEIVESLFKEQGYTDFEIKCLQTYPKREYCVQYRESHLNFVCRLLEEEGIFYFFQHFKDKHVLVLADHTSAVKYCSGIKTVRMANTGGFQEDETVTELERELSVTTGKVTLRDYDYLKPAVLLESSMAGEEQGEEYDYPGNYLQRQDGDRYARLRLEEYESRRCLVRGSGNCRAFQSGGRFDLTEHYAEGTNTGYQLLQVRHAAYVEGYRSEDAAGFQYHNEFLAIPCDVPYRPPQVTRKPVVHGSQTAVVVGKSGEEIWVDKYGRVKVQFHWDRQGKRDENSSCWVRVSSTWAGKNWGFVQIPRIGQEVIVDFLEGDPDQPIITGRVYNADQMPPYALPTNQTQSGVKSRSSKGGTGENFNELRFEDKKGGEEIYIHAERNKRVVVEVDRSESVGHDERIGVGNDRSETVGGNESITIEGNRTESVGKNESITIGANRTESVAKNESIDVGESRTETVGKDESVTVGKNETVSVGEVRRHSVGKDDVLDVGKNLLINVADSITIKTGDASITMKKNGDIQIKGKNLKLDGSGKIQIKASSNVNIKGSKVTNN
jgi:type VI secretion system secreted protein VgrG